MSCSSLDIMKEGDHVVITGGGLHKIAEIKQNNIIRLGKAGSANAISLVGLPFGCAVQLDSKQRRFILTDAYPDLDLSTTNDAGERDNRSLIPNSESQQLTNSEVEVIRKEKGVDVLLDRLVENSITFQSKTNFAQEKYIRKKKKLYGILYKVEAVHPDNLAEVYVPTINPIDELPLECKCTRLRCDTLALILHHANVHASSRVLTYNKTNGVLEACVLDRLGESGEVFQVLDKSAQPNTFTAAKVMGIHNVKERWRAVPGNDDFLRETGDLATVRKTNLQCNNYNERDDQAININDDNINCNSRKLEEPEKDSSNANTISDKGHSNNSTDNHVKTQSNSLWMTGKRARELLMEHPADCLIIIDCEHDDASFSATSRLVELLQFVSKGGHVVVYSAFLEVLTNLFDILRDECINMCISETWYRHYQVLPQRTHPTVNMNTAGGYLLTAIRVESYSCVQQHSEHEKFNYCNNNTNNNNKNDDEANLRGLHKRLRDESKYDEHIEATE